MYKGDMIWQLAWSTFEQNIRIIQFVLRFYCTLLVKKAFMQIMNKVSGLTEQKFERKVCVCVASVDSKFLVFVYLECLIITHSTARHKLVGYFSENNRNY